jgi:FkbM family methyltransferase
MELFPRWETEVWEGTHEMEVQQLFAQHVRAGTTFYDIGGGSGFYSMVAARLGAQVIVFEASAENGASISRHLERNGLERQVRLIHSAVFSHTGVVSLQGSARETGHGNYRVQAVDPESTQLPRVSCTTLDDFVKENPKPDFVKIDVEGAESEVLKGAETLFCTARPLLVCEIHDEANASFATRWLEEKNYMSRWLEDDSRFPRHLYASPLASAA